MHDEIVLTALRAQAWQRAKGELRAMLEAHRAPAGLGPQFYMEHAERYDKLHEMVTNFIEAFEDEGYHE